MISRSNLLRHMSAITFLLLLSYLPAAEATRIYDIQFNEASQGTSPDCFPSPLRGQSVTVSGVVTGVAQNTTHREFWLQDSSGLWSGVYVYDRFDRITSLSLGDTVSLTGKVAESSGLTRLDSLTDFTNHASGRAGPTPLAVTCGDIGRGCSASGEAFEGVLVRLASVEVIHDLNANGEWYVRSLSGTDSCQIDDRIFRYDPSLGDRIGAIIGVVYYSNGEYEIDPRGQSDILVGADTPPYISELTQSPARPRYQDAVQITARITDDHLGVEGRLNYFVSAETTQVSLLDDGLHGDGQAGDSVFGASIPPQPRGTTVYYYLEAEDSIGQVTRTSLSTYSVSTAVPISDVQRPGADGFTSSLVNAVVTVEGVITGPPAVLSSPTSSRASFYIQDATGGVNVYGGDKSDPDLVLGQNVEVVGQVTEYNGTTEVSATDETYARVTPLGMQAVPGPRGLIYNQFITEGLEGLLVEFTGAVVDAPVVSGSGKNFNVRNGNSNIAIRVGDATGINTSAVTPGLRVHITGIASQYDSDPPYDSGYQVLLRFPEDVTPVTDSLPPSPEPRIMAITPNPFAPDLGEVVRIEVNAPVSTRLTLRLFDLEGRHVKTLLENVPGGHQEVVWDGTNGRQEKVTIGMYLCHLGAIDPAGKATNLNRIVVVGTPRR